MLLCSCTALRLAPSQPVGGARRRNSPDMGLFDGAKEAFGAGEKPLVGGDRITPFDRWLGLDKELESETIERVGAAGVSYVDPNDVTAYFSVALAKPMGIAFVENVGECQGLVVDEVLPTGAAADSETAILSGDQLVAVDATLVLGNDFDTGLDVRRRSHTPPPTHLLSTAEPHARRQSRLRRERRSSSSFFAGQPCSCTAPRSRTMNGIRATSYRSVLRGPRFPFPDS